MQLWITQTQSVVKNSRLCVRGNAQTVLMTFCFLNKIFKQLDGAHEQSDWLGTIDFGEFVPSNNYVSFEITMPSYSNRVFLRDSEGKKNLNKKLRFCANFP